MNSFIFFLFAPFRHFSIRQKYITIVTSYRSPCRTFSEPARSYGYLASLLVQDVEQGRIITKLLKYVLDKYQSLITHNTVLYVCCWNRTPGLLSRWYLMMEGSELLCMDCANHCFALTVAHGLLYMDCDKKHKKTTN